MQEERVSAAANAYRIFLVFMGCLEIKFQTEGEGAFGGNCAGKEFGVDPQIVGCDDSQVLGLQIDRGPAQPDFVHDACRDVVRQVDLLEPDMVCAVDVYVQHGQVILVVCHAVVAFFQPGNGMGAVQDFRNIPVGNHFLPVVGHVIAEIGCVTEYMPEFSNRCHRDVEVVDAESDPQAGDMGGLPLHRSRRASSGRRRSRSGWRTSGASYRHNSGRRARHCH